MAHFLTRNLTGHLLVVNGTFSYYENDPVNDWPYRKHAFTLRLPAPVDFDPDEPVCAFTPIHTHQQSNEYHDMVVTATVLFAGSIVPAHIKRAPVPSVLGFLPYLHDANVSDCSFLAKGMKTPLHASRVLLMRSSSFFKRMLSGPWLESVHDPIPLAAWDAPAVALVFVHIYSGWVPNDPLPAKTPARLVEDFACDPTGLTYATWRNLFELARMLGLKDLGLAVNRKLVALLYQEQDDVAAEPESDSEGDAVEGNNVRKVCEE
ncbi:hypothetical protein GGF32_004018 [Allomyces javanicus]|nr:hypothetical protein GGF32_004018 [Allomyces javanicus]